MPQRKPWTQEEDTLLKQLRQNQNISKWSLIAKRMFEQFHMPCRTGKQCRERYHNHLDAKILRSQWTPQEEQYLYKLHDQIGNKWAIIAQKLPGRTDNCVKNHFYSKMRKAIRKLNKVIHTHYKKQIKEIKLNVLYKLVEATDEKFKVNPIIDQEISDRCCQLKNLLLQYANTDQDSEEQENILKLYELAKSIHQVSSRYRKRPKRSRRNSAHISQIIPLGKFSPKYCSAHSDHEFSSEDQQDSFGENSQDVFTSKSKLESVKQQVQLKDGTFTVPSFVQNQNFQIKFQDEHEQNQVQNRNRNLMFSYPQDDQYYNFNNEIDLENSLSQPRIENMLGEEIQRLNIEDFNLMQAEQYDEKII